ncbi:MAG: D-alanine--D-alanine ligase family protein [Chloroflexota bacterium]
MSRKLRVALLFGGQSGEHEVSLASAASVLAALDREKYDVVGIGITRQGRWLMSTSPERLLRQEVTPQLPDTIEVMPDLAHQSITAVAAQNGDRSEDAPIDIVFPLLHGPRGEDGTVQGLLDITGLPYVGSGVLGSAVSMDKVTMKGLLAGAGLPQAAYRLIKRSRWERVRNETLYEIETNMDYPVFVKPCNLGSSVGISKAHERTDLEAAIDLAARFDTRIIVEQGIDAREVECSVMGNDDPLVSVAGEVISHREFYDYEAKYTDGLSDLRIPAQLTRDQTDTVGDFARRAFEAVDAAGLARVDFFIRRVDGAVLVNEINTIPGFTATSMYPKLWEASGVSYGELVDRLIQYGMQRFDDRANRSTQR